MPLDQVVQANHDAAAAGGGPTAAHAAATAAAAKIVLTAAGVTPQSLSNQADVAIGDRKVKVKRPAFIPPQIGACDVMRGLGMDCVRRHVNTGTNPLSFPSPILFCSSLFCCVYVYTHTGSFARAVSNSIRGALAFKLLEDPDTFDASATAR